MANNIPKHVAFIMDGNRRWARERGLPTLEGHRLGYEKMKEVGEWCIKRGVAVVTVYAFSTENWQRSAEEVKYLMQLLLRALTNELNAFHERNMRLRIIGQISALSQELRTAISAAERKTERNTEGVLNIAINYGGRQEIIDATKAIIESGVHSDAINEDLFKKYLYAPEGPEPDIIIRTGGEQRLSGFLLWGSAYSELYFEKHYWPDFSESDLEAAFFWYAGRERRHGK